MLTLTPSDSHSSRPMLSVATFHDLGYAYVFNCLCCIRTPGRVSTMVFLSYFLSGASLPFSSGMRMPCGEGLSPRPTQNFASVMTHKVAINISVLSSQIKPRNGILQISRQIVHICAGNGALLYDHVVK